MKVVNAFTTVFATLAFLTLGSLLLMVALHLLAVQDAIYRIQEIYSNPWKSIQTGALGLLFILVGLASAKAFIKGGRDSEVPSAQEWVDSGRSCRRGDGEPFMSRVITRASRYQPRRIRQVPALRELLRETRLSPSQIVAPCS